MSLTGKERPVRAYREVLAVCADQLLTAGIVRVRIATTLYQLNCLYWKSSSTACRGYAHPGINLRRALGGGADIDVEDFGRNVHR